MAQRGGHWAELTFQSVARQQPPLALSVTRSSCPSFSPSTSLTPLLMQSPLLPWEVIERVISHSHSGDDLEVETLSSFSLTCHQLRPHALCCMVADVGFKNRDQIFSFCDFLHAKPHLNPLVRSIVVNPVDFAPFPLLHILPNLSKIRLYSLFHSEDYYSVDSSNEGNSSEDRRVADGHSSQDRDASRCRRRRRREVLHPVVLNPSTLVCCQRFGTHIQALHLFVVSFSTYLDFARVLLAFANITHLTCEHTIIRAEGDSAPLEVIKRRLSERLRLLAVSLHHT